MAAAGLGQVYKGFFTDGSMQGQVAAVKVITTGYSCTLAKVGAATACQATWGLCLRLLLVVFFCLLGLWSGGVWSGGVCWGGGG